MKAVIYHNTKCSKSNAALNLLLEHGVQANIVNYLETPLSFGQLEILLNQLSIKAKALIRFGEPIAKELGLSSNDNRSENEWASFMIDHPILIERPIVVIGDKAVIGRPLQSVLDFIEHA
ncbi:MAG: arsenate reductase (glutaredoxin) [Arenimonas sp.]